MIHHKIEREPAVRHLWDVMICGSQRITGSWILWAPMKGIWWHLHVWSSIITIFRGNRGWCRKLSLWKRDLVFVSLSRYYQFVPFLLFLVVDQLFLNSFPISLSSKIFGTRLIRRRLHFWKNNFGIKILEEKE